MQWKLLRKGTIGLGVDGPNNTGLFTITGKTKGGVPNGMYVLVIPGKAPLESDDLSYLKLLAERIYNERRELGL